MRPCPGPHAAGGGQQGGGRPVKLVVMSSAVAAGSGSSSAWSPSAPAAARTRSMSPKRSNTSSTGGRRAGQVGGVEGHRLDHVGPGRPGRVRRGVEPVARPAGQHHVRHRPGTSPATMAWAISEAPPRTSTDWGRPVASIMVVLPLSSRGGAVPAGGGRASVHSPSRRPRSRAGATPSGSTRRRTSRNRRPRGTWPGTSRERAGCPWPGRGGPRPSTIASSSSRSPSSRVADGQVEGEGPARHREREGARVAGAEALQHGEEARPPHPVSRSMARRTVSPAASGTTNWYWRKPLGRRGGSTRPRRRAGGRSRSCGGACPAGAWAPCGTRTR